MDQMQTMGQAPAQDGMVSVVPQKNRRRGLLLFFGTFIALPLILIAWSVVSVVMRTMVAATPVTMNTVGTIQLREPSTASAVGAVLNVVFGFLGILSFFLWIPGVILMLRRTEQRPWSEFDARSGKGEQSVVPQEIKGWNWGAAFISLPWGLYHRVFWSLLVFVPFVNMIWWIVMGMMGNEWAWKAMPWKSVEEFHAYQKPWKLWGIFFFILGVLLFIGSIILQIAAFALLAGMGVAGAGPGMMQY